MAHQPLLSRRQRTASVATGSASLAATALLIGGLFVAWHSISIFGVEAIQTYPWGGKATDPSNGCTEYKIWAGSETNNCADGSSSPPESQKSKDGQNLLKIQSYAMGAALVALLAGSIIVLIKKTRGAFAKVVLLVGAVLAVGAFVLYMVGEQMFFDGGKEEVSAAGGPGALLNNGIGAGLWMGAIGIVIALASAIVVLILHKGLAGPAYVAPLPGRPAAAGAPLGATSAGAPPRVAPTRALPPGARAVLCPRCRSRVVVPAGAKPSCGNCGFGA